MQMSIIVRKFISNVIIKLKSWKLFIMISFKNIPVFLFVYTYIGSPSHVAHVTTVGMFCWGKITCHAMWQWYTCCLLTNSLFYFYFKFIFFVNTKLVLFLIAFLQDFCSTCQCASFYVLSFASLFLAKVFAALCVVQYYKIVLIPPTLHGSYVLLFTEN